MVPFSTVYTETFHAVFISFRFQIVPFSNSFSFDAGYENVSVKTEWHDFIPFSFETA